MRLRTQWAAGAPRLCPSLALSGPWKRALCASALRGTTAPPLSREPTETMDLCPRLAYWVRQLLLTSLLAPGVGCSASCEPVE